jgi:hypothetical protein
MIGANYRIGVSIDTHGCALLHICRAVGTGQGVEVAPTASPEVLAAQQSGISPLRVGQPATLE